MFLPGESYGQRSLVAYSPQDCKESGTIVRMLAHTHTHTHKWKVSVSCSVISNSLWSHGLYPTRVLCPWNSPGMNTGVGCHSLLQRIFLTQGSNLGFPHKQADSLLSEPPRKHVCVCVCVCISTTTALKERQGITARLRRITECLMNFWHHSHTLPSILYKSPFHCTLERIPT